MDHNTLTDAQQQERREFIEQLIFECVRTVPPTITTEQFTTAIGKVVAFRDQQLGLTK